jgi:hypothetical protein
VFWTPYAQLTTMRSEALVMLSRPPGWGSNRTKSCVPVFGLTDVTSNAGADGLS